MSALFAHPIAFALGIALIGLAVLVALALSRRPRNDRDWRDHLARLAHVIMDDAGFTIDNVKDWTFSPDGATDRSYTSFAARFADLHRIWFVVEPSPESDWIAHTLLLFEFDGERLVAITIEARVVKGEKWTPFAGLWNRFELLYQWATARDVLTGRAVFLKHRIYIYPLNLAEEQRVNLLSNMLATTAKLDAHPRFYNTLFSNCTNELGKRANLPWRAEFILTGRAAYRLHRMGVIPGASFAAAEHKADFTARVKELNALPKADFDPALLAALRSG
jgi:Domain of unknown function (DUF4105)